MIRLRTIALLAGAASLTACNMAPTYVRSVSGFVAPDWPSGAAYPAAADGGAGMTWQVLATDPKLRAVITRAFNRHNSSAAFEACIALARDFAAGRLV